MTSTRSTDMIIIFLLIHLSIASSAVDVMSQSYSVQHCEKDTHSIIPVGRRREVLYYTWNHKINKFVEHCHFDNEKEHNVNNNIMNEDVNNLYEKSNLDVAKLTRSWSQSQAQQDVMMANMFKSVPNPFYVDLAANHWIYISNTYALDTYRHWKGICIEPTSQYLAGLVVNRTCTVVKNVVSGKDNEEIEYVHHGSLGGIVGGDKGSGLDNFHGNPELSSDLTKEILHTVTLTTILTTFKAPSIIEYLSLDVEGAEQLVLSGVDFEKFIFLAITIERPPRVVHELLVTNSYYWVTRMSMFGECLYIHKTHPDFNEFMVRYKYTRIDKESTAWRTGKHKPLVGHKYMRIGNNISLTQIPLPKKRKKKNMRRYRKKKRVGT